MRLDLDQFLRVAAHASAWRFRQRFMGVEPPLNPDRSLTPGVENPRLLAEATNDMARAFYGHAGRAANKWEHYLEIYDRHLAPFRGTRVRFLEIGVFFGGSLEIWRGFLGPEATIFGVDIDPACAGRVDPPNQVRIGSQADPDFLRGVVAEMGGVDVVLDDGSHMAKHQSASFATLFPLLSEGGLYMIEDMHTAYWPRQFRGGLRRKGTAVELVKEMIDDLHRWYHWESRPSHGPIRAVHAYDSLAIIEKETTARPSRVVTPAGSLGQL